jgi:hypothetical protein
MNNPDLIEWLDNLLFERKQLRDLLHRRIVALRYADSAKSVPLLEEKIAQLITDPLALSKREAPGTPALVAVATELPVQPVR